MKAVTHAPHNPCTALSYLFGYELRAHERLLGCVFGFSSNVLNGSAYYIGLGHL